MDRRPVAPRSRVVKGGPKGGRRHALGSVRPTATYSVEEIRKLLQVHENTVRGWIRDGLAVIDGEYPAVVHGRALLDFLRALQQRQKRPCAANEFYCFGCHAPRTPTVGSVRFVVRNSKQLMITGNCTDCGTALNRVGSVHRLAEYEATFVQPEQGEGTLNEREPPLSHCDSREETEDD